MKTQVNNKSKSIRKEDIIISRDLNYFIMNNIVPNTTYTFTLEAISQSDNIVLTTSLNSINVTSSSKKDDLMDISLKLRISRILSKIIDIDVIHDTDSHHLFSKKNHSMNISYLNQMIIAIVIASLAILIVILLIIFIICRLYKEKESSIYWVNNE